jgi:ABC-type dipeptide/oligopeptide/nickel transport system permease component
MLNYIVRRLVLMVPTLIGVTAVVFFVMALSPGGVGGPLLSAMGEMEAEKAKAMRDYYNRRYGLDQPLMVQYGRWLNRVSPLGFRTSSQIQFPDDQLAQVREILLESPFLDTSTKVQQATAIVTVTAAYTRQDLLDTARQVLRVLEQPDRAFELFAVIDSEPDEAFVQRLEAALPDNIPAGRALVLARLSEEVNGKDRILFTRPALKWPDLGDSLAKGRPVTDLYAEALPITLLLNAISTPIIYFIAIFTGLYAARHRGKVLDVTSGFTLLGLWSAPTIWVGVMLIGFLANRDYFYWFPAGGLSSTLAGQMPFLPRVSEAGFDRGWLLDRLWHLALPVACLTYGGFAFLSKLMRSAVLETLSADYIRTARAKGLSDRVVLWQHAFRNSLLPLITVAAYLIPSLLVGSVIVETIFSIPGMGRLTIDAIYARDRELVLAGALISGILGLLSILLADLCYAIADPRVSYD